MNGELTCTTIASARPGMVAQTNPNAPNSPAPTGLIPVCVALGPLRRARLQYGPESKLDVEVARLRERVEDLEDAKELDAAISRNGGKPLIPWDQAKKELGLEL